MSPLVNPGGTPPAATANPLTVWASTHADYIPRTFPESWQPEIRANLDRLTTTTQDALERLWLVDSNGELSFIGKLNRADGIKVEFERFLAQFRTQTVVATQNELDADRERILNPRLVGSDTQELL